jgi:hypothetical protein
MCRATHVADPSFRVAASQADETCEESGERAGARQAIIVHAQSEIAVRTRRVRREQAAVDVAHCFRVFGRAVGMAVLLALPRTIAECGRQPEVSSRPGRGMRASQRHAEQRVDALQREVGGVAGRCPPDVGARLKDDRRGIGRRARAQRREIGRGALEIAAIQLIEAGAQGRRALECQHDRRKRRHVSEVRR